MNKTLEDHNVGALCKAAKCVALLSSRPPDVRMVDATAVPASKTTHDARAVTDDPETVSEEREESPAAQVRSFCCFCSVLLVMFVLSSFGSKFHAYFFVVVSSRY